MATAIALASDILGSAVTTSVYARNKNIDLKRGWILTVCVIGMCAAGSIAAYFTQQQVLGGFSLFLCVAIGIRFLVKPNSGEKADRKRTVRLSKFQIAISLFFGLTIGFGTGFFGSGGGMMMLIVFTAMLGYDRKTAVGYATGVILLGLGLTLVFLNYKDQINRVLFLEFWKLMGLYLGFIIAFAAVLILLRFLIRIPDYIFRKLLHIVAFTSVFPLVLGTDIWQVAVLVEIVFLIIVIFALHFFEHFPFYSALFVEKGKHEVITSFILLFGMITAMLAIFWGGFGDNCAFVAVAALYFFSGYSPVQILDLSLIIASVSAFVELYTRHGLDTITVPISASLILGAAVLIL